MTNAEIYSGPIFSLRTRPTPISNLPVIAAGVSSLTEISRSLATHFTHGLPDLMMLSISAILHELLENTGKVLSRQQLEQGLYGWEDDIESNALEVHIHHLRKKLYPELIKTIRGVGYIIEKLKP